MEEQLIPHVIPLEVRLIDAIEVIRENRNRCVIVRAGEKVVGVLSEGDVMRALLRGADVHSPIEDWVSRSFKFLPAIDYQQALDLMRQYGITMIPILDANFALIDVVSLADILGRVELRQSQP
jgi:CBS domain-containing protein